MCIITKKGRWSQKGKRDGDQFYCFFACGVIADFLTYPHPVLGALLSEEGVMF